MTAARSETVRRAGYSALIEMLNVDVLPNWHESLVVFGSSHRVEAKGHIVRETYPASYWPGDTAGAHLEFALKYDGTNLSILAEVFRKVDVADLLSYIQSKPTGKYARRLWFFYEFLMGSRLSLDDLRRGNYVDLLDINEYYTSERSRKVRRQRINDNLLGGRGFCPLVRRTERMSGFEAANLAERCRQILESYPVDLLRRALSYLYTKETKSSFEIERIAPSSDRIERFVALLQSAEREDFVERERLIDLQNQIVDPRFAEADYREAQNYVGETIAWRQERARYVCPKPEHIDCLMDGLIEAHRRMADSGVQPVVHAAAVAYGFVFLHPFEDGNGRIHRFLIHNILARHGFTPKGVIFPVSAVMLRQSAAYDDSLEAFSRPLMSVIDYTLDDGGRMTVNNDTTTFYRYIDMTTQAEALFSFVETTIDTELVEELTFLANYDRTKAAIQNIVDMPDRKIDLFIRLCLQNNGRLSRQKRDSQFATLKDDEVAGMEEAVRRGYAVDQTE